MATAAMKAETSLMPIIQTPDLGNLPPKHGAEDVVNAEFLAKRPHRRNDM